MNFGGKENLTKKPNFSFFIFHFPSPATHSSKLLTLNFDILTKQLT